MDNRLHHAVAVSRHASFSRAAQSAGVTQSAVTKSVADLERQLGFVLFNRTSKGIYPTEEGRDFLDRAARLLADANDLFRSRQKANDSYEGVLRVGIYPGSLEWLLTESFSELVRFHPSVRLNVNTGTSERGRKLLNRGDIDTAIGFYAAFQGWKGVNCHLVGEVKTLCFVRRGHPLLRQREPSVDDKLKYGFVCPSMSAPYVNKVREDYQTRGLDVESDMHILDFYPLAQSLVAQSDTIGVTTASLSRGADFATRFVILEEKADAPSAYFGIGLASRAGWPEKPALKALRALLMKHISPP